MGLRPIFSTLVLAANFRHAVHLGIVRDNILRSEPGLDYPENPVSCILYIDLSQFYLNSFRTQLLS